MYTYQLLQIVFSSNAVTSNNVVNLLGIVFILE